MLATGWVRSGIYYPYPEEPLTPNLAASGQSRDRRGWLKHTSGYLRLVGVFFCCHSLGSTVLLIAGTGGIQK